MEKGPPREGKLLLEPLDPETFFSMVIRAARSDEIGAVGSQFTERLKTKDPGVGILGLKACGQLIGAVSYGVQPVLREPGCVTGRLDVVVTEPDFRGQKVGSILMVGLFDFFLEKYGQKLREISTVAVHPAVAHYVSKLGFLPPTSKEASTPRYYIPLDTEEQFRDFQRKVNHDISSYMGTLKLQCLKCQRWRWESPWCRPEKKEKKAS